jgi:hypothetical protein
MATNIARSVAKVALLASPLVNINGGQLAQVTLIIITLGFALVGYISENVNSVEKWNNYRLD